MPALSQLGPVSRVPVTVECGDVNEPVAFVSFTIELAFGTLTGAHTDHVPASRVRRRRHELAQRAARATGAQRQLAPRLTVTDSRQRCLSRPARYRRARLVPHDTSLPGHVGPDPPRAPPRPPDGGRLVRCLSAGRLRWAIRDIVARRGSTAAAAIARCSETALGLTKREPPPAGVWPTPACRRRLRKRPSAAAGARAEGAQVEAWASTWSTLRACRRRIGP